MGDKQTYANATGNFTFMTAADVNVQRAGNASMEAAGTLTLKAFTVKFVARAIKMTKV
ncbi:hypothetical protein AAH446_02420 [Erwinia sp. P6884]|uniref:hypothetical protein n=1 Tax=Erwinia sp. P6884 TaxID=3141450 RepID=UPI00318AEE9E